MNFHDRLFDAARLARKAYDKALDLLLGEEEEFEYEFSTTPECWPQEPPPGRRRGSC